MALKRSAGGFWAGAAAEAGGEVPGAAAETAGVCQQKTVTGYIAALT